MANYVVRKGDTLSKIAEKYGTTVSKVASLNQIVDVNKIAVGQILALPSASKDFEAIGKQMEVCLTDIENLPSFQRFLKMI